MMKIEMLMNEKSDTQGAKRRINTKFENSGINCYLVGHASS